MSATQAPRTVFLHGRPSHPFHQALARSVAADLLPIDFLLRYQDVPAPRSRRYLSWLATSAFFPAPGRYDVFLTEGLQFSPLLMKRLRRLRPGQRAVGLLANETLYFLRAGRYGRVTRTALLSGLLAYDAVVCHGQMMADLAREALGGASAGPRVFVVRSGLSAERRAALSPAQVRPDLHGRRLLFIGGGTTAWRAWYKGVDLLLGAGALAVREAPDLRVGIAGGWPPGGEAACFGLRELPPWLDLLGEQRDLRPALRSASLYVALGRGDAGPLSVLEAMHAGVPALVSEWTGLRDAVAEVDPRLVVPLDEVAAGRRILWYLGLPPAEREDLSARAAAVAARYTEDRSIEDFRAALGNL